MGIRRDSASTFGEFAEDESAAGVVFGGCGDLGTLGSPAFGDGVLGCARFGNAGFVDEAEFPVVTGLAFFITPFRDFVQSTMAVARGETLSAGYALAGKSGKRIQRDEPVE